MLKLKLQYFGQLMLTDNSLEKSLMLGEIEGRRRRGHQRMRWLDDITDAMDMNLGKLSEIGQGGLQCFSPWVCKKLDKTVQLNNIFKFTDSSSALYIMLLSTFTEAFVAIIIFCSKLSVCLLFTFYISLSLLCIL